MSSAGPFDSATLQRLAREYLDVWSEGLRQVGLKAPFGMDGRAAPAAGDAAAEGEAAGARQDDDSPAPDWFSLMQRLAGQLAGTDTDAAGIARAWGEMLGGQGSDPFSPFIQRMGPRNAAGMDPWMQQVMPMLQALQQQAAQWLQLPAVGLAREHQERWQALAQAVQEYQERAKAYQALLAEAGKQAMALFERKLQQHAESGLQLSSARALFDLWIDAAEDAYAQAALSPEFAQVSGELANAQMRVRAGVQGEVEKLSALLGMPTRTEVDSAHRKIAELERALRRFTHAATGTPAARDPAPPDGEPRAQATPGDGQAPGAEDTVAPGTDPRADRAGAHAPKGRPSARKAPAGPAARPRRTAADTARPVPRKNSAAANGPAVSVTERPAGARSGTGPAAADSAAARPARSAKRRPKPAAPPAGAPRKTRRRPRP